MRVGDTGLLKRAEEAYRGALDESDGNWPAWPGDIVRKNLDGIVRARKGLKTGRRVAGNG